MKIKHSGQIERSEVADILEEIAGYFRKGAFSLEDTAWQIPDVLDVGFKHKEKNGRIATRIEWHWSTLAEYDTTAREKVARWQASFNSVKKRLGRGRKRAAGCRRPRIARSERPLQNQGGHKVPRRAGLPA